MVLNVLNCVNLVIETTRVKRWLYADVSEANIHPVLFVQLLISVFKNLKNRTILYIIHLKTLFR